MPYDRTKDRKSAEAAEPLAGLPINQAFTKFVIDDPEVSALGQKVIDVDKRYESVFEHGRCLLDKGLWPVVGEVSPFPYFDRDDPAIVLSRMDVPEIAHQAIDALRDRYRAFIGFLVSGDLIANGVNSEGVNVPILTGVWASRDFLVDFERGRIGKYGKQSRTAAAPDFDVLWSGVTLKRPERAPASLDHGKQRDSGSRDASPNDRQHQSKKGRDPKYPWDAAFERLLIRLGKEGHPETGADLAQWLLSELKHEWPGDLPGFNQAVAWLKRHHIQLWNHIVHGGSKT